MADYSAITSLRVKNFRNIGDVTLSFEESPIITLMGENEAGKTSIVKAIAVIGANAYPTRQARFVRTGTSGFGIQVAFADGGYIVRQKGGPGIGNTIRVKFADGTEARDDKIDRGEGIPVNMEKVMGFMVEPETGELLNVRTYEDALMFVTTPDSANYKVLYNALKVGQVTRAIKAGNKEVSALRSEIDANSVRIDGVQQTIKGIRIVDLAPLTGIKQRIQTELSNLKLLEEAVRIVRSIEAAEAGLGALAELNRQQLRQVDVRTLEWFGQAVTAAGQLGMAEASLGSIQEASKLSLVDVKTLEKLEDAVQTATELYGQNEDANRYSKLASVSPVSADVLDRLADAMNVAGQYDRACEDAKRFDGVTGLKNLDTSTITLLVDSLGDFDAIESKTRKLSEVKGDTQKCVEAIKVAGGEVGMCSNCGHLVVVSEFSKMDGCECSHG